MSARRQGQSGASHTPPRPASSLSLRDIAQTILQACQLYMSETGKAKESNASAHMSPPILTETNDTGAICFYLEGYGSVLFPRNTDFAVIIKKVPDQPQWSTGLCARNIWEDGKARPESAHEPLVRGEGMESRARAIVDLRDQVEERLWRRFGGPKL
ncbi:hypothetical protein M011DRAFT_478271 [Sporormia fimetaria CBS 119925]|uniref:Uncharacterized protein n=1 Tax=Sporormia fimetaria CBS 119925 TaxID=1340428 RepID=A0A6A6V6Q3_9PLEO|nr:hypothetical protein M011DRAFT_478271 [Sporormia fimetaria CBS 119925]